ncbi:hypothetical protein [Spirosoma aerophilum]
MEKLEQLSFTDLMAVRAYYMEKLSDKKAISKSEIKENTLQNIALIEQSIDKKFVDLITTDAPVDGSITYTVPIRSTTL